MPYIFWGTLLIILIGGYFLHRTGKKTSRPSPAIPDQGRKETASAHEKTYDSREEISRLTFLANTDSTTGLYNYRYFSCKFDEILAEAKKTGQAVALVLFDFDDFRYCNQTAGRRKGDEILRAAAGRINQLAPRSGITARSGGDEILLLLPGYTPNQAADLAEMITKEVAFAFSGKEEVYLTTGIAGYPEAGSSKEALIDYAYQELYRAKAWQLHKLSSCRLVLQSLQMEDPAFHELRFLAKFFLLTIQLRDNYTLSHTDSVVQYAQGLAVALSLTGKEIDNIALGALFHDVGKIQIPGQLLMKQGALTEKEWHCIRQHPHWSGEILSGIIHQESVISLVTHHHERFDGAGYPNGLAGDRIPLGARIIALADSFSAMISHRPYRKAFPVSQALKEVKKNAGTQFDPELSDTFIRIIPQLIRKGPADGGQ